MPLQQGSMAGPYEILSTLGSGGMGTVYLARDRRLDRRVALKVPDGRELVVWRHDGNVWRCEVESGACTMVTQGRAPVWSGDARRIYVMRAPRGWDQGVEVWSVGRNGGDPRFEAALGNFRPTDRYFDVSRERSLAWAPWRRGEHEVWTATVR